MRTDSGDLAAFRSLGYGSALKIKEIGNNSIMIKGEAGDSLNFGVNNSDIPRMTIDSLGKVGI